MQGSLNGAGELAIDITGFNFHQLEELRTRVRCSIRQLCCSAVLVSTKRMLGRITASRIASASAASFFWRLRYGFT